MEIGRKWLPCSPSQQNLSRRPTPSPSLLSHFHPLYNPCQPDFCSRRPIKTAFDKAANHLVFINTEGHLLSSFTHCASIIPHSRLFPPSKILSFCFPSSHTPPTLLASLSWTPLLVFPLPSDLWMIGCLRTWPGSYSISSKIIFSYPIAWNTIRCDYLLN